MTRVGDSALGAEAAGYEETGVSAFRDAAMLAARAMDYKGATRWINEGCAMPTRSSSPIARTS